MLLETAKRDLGHIEKKSKSWIGQEEESRVPKVRQRRKFQSEK